MVREFSEEKKEELYRILTSLDDSPCGSFLEWCGSRRYEFGDWMDRLSIPSYMGKIDQFETRITDMNASIRSQIDTVFSNVYAIDRKYGEIFQNYAEIVKGQKQLVDDMREMLHSGNFDKKGSKRQMSTIDEGIDKWLEDISIEGFESRLGMYRHGEQYGIDYEELQDYLRSMLEEHIITQSEYDYLSRIIINYGHVPSSVEETITRDINELLSNRKQLITSVDEKIEEARLSMSSDNPRAIVEYRLLNEYKNELFDSTMTLDEIEEVIDTLEERNPQMLKNIGVLYWYDPSVCDSQMNKVIKIAASYLLKPTGKGIGEIQLYDAPTVGSEGRNVNIPANADRSSWASFEPLDDINFWAKRVIGDSNAVYNEGGVLTDKDGRYWIAVGPNVMNPNHADGETISLEEMNYGTKIDVVVCDVDGNKYYIPCVVGDCKQHTYPTGIIQTGRNFPNGGDYHPENEDGSIIEFFTPETEYSEYKLLDVIVYDNE